MDKGFSTSDDQQMEPSEDRIKKKIVEDIRPWGTFKQYAYNENCTVKIITVDANQKLSKQIHKNRDELWIILDKGLDVELNGEILHPNVGDEIIIHRNTIHRLSSTGKKGRVMEVAFGDFDENDTERLDDIYGRKLEAMTQKGTLQYLVMQLEKSLNKADVTSKHLWYAVRGALNSKLLISNLAEALRVSAKETEQLLIKNGFGDLVAQNKISNKSESDSMHPLMEYTIPSSGKLFYPYQDLFSIEFSPPLSQPIKLTSSQHEAVSLIIKDITQSIKNDAFLPLYRERVLQYYDQFMASDAKLIDRFIANHFKQGYPRYIVNIGIGGNEQFNHFVAHLNNLDPMRQVTWLVIDSPRQLVKLPADANKENTLFMEFSRSGKTEETVKIHEYTSREAKRVVFANNGPLKDLGIRDNNLILEFPEQVAGRFGRNKTPVLLAPMHVAKMDTHRFWRMIENATKVFDLSSPTSLPVQIAQFIYTYQHKNGINHIYFGCNDDILICSADELLQFWNEGVNKGGNDISMSRYFGLPRDSHLNIEAILANHRTKMGIFLFRDKMAPSQLPPMTNKEIDPINSAHKSLCYGDEEVILAEANYQRFCELMPSIKITVLGELTTDHATVLGQLWSDITFFYSRMANVDPGSNPEVKYVRDRSDKLLAEANRSKK